MIKLVDGGLVAEMTMKIADLENEAASSRLELEAERKAREEEEERLTVKCGGTNSIGGCGKPMPIGAAYRCSDCEQYFHRDCLRQHCETSSYVTAIRQNAELIDGWKKDVATAEQRATDAEAALQAERERRVEELWTKCVFVGLPPEGYESWQAFCEAHVKRGVTITRAAFPEIEAGS